MAEAKTAKKQTKKLSETDIKVAEAIKSARKNQNLTYANLQKKTGITYNTISSIEKQLQPASLQSKIALFQALNIHPDKSVPLTNTQALKKKTLGERVHYLRLLKRLSIDELATATGYSPSSIDNIERGIVKNPSNLDRIALIFDVTLAQIANLSTDVDISKCHASTPGGRLKAVREYMQLSKSDFVQNVADAFLKQNPTGTPIKYGNYYHLELDRKQKLTAADFQQVADYLSASPEFFLYGKLEDKPAEPAPSPAPDAEAAEPQKKAPDLKLVPIPPQTVLEASPSPLAKAVSNIRSDQSITTDDLAAHLKTNVSALLELEGSKTDTLLSSAALDAAARLLTNLYTSAMNDAAPLPQKVHAKKTQLPVKKLTVKTSASDKSPEETYQQTNDTVGNISLTPDKAEHLAFKMPEDSLHPLYSLNDILIVNTNDIPKDENRIMIITKDHSVLLGLQIETTATGVKVLQQEENTIENKDILEHWIVEMIVSPATPFTS